MGIEKKFGAVVRRLRRERRTSQESLASLSGLDRTFISHLESGKQQPSLLSIVALAKALKINPSRIMLELEHIIALRDPRPATSKSTDELEWLKEVRKGWDDAGPYDSIETILFVDDEESMRNALSEFLVDAGFTIITAGDGVEAVEIFEKRRHEVDIVIMDIAMPRKDGIQAFKEMKAINPDCNIILISAYFPDYLTECPVEILQKPFQPLQLLEKIRNLIDRVA